MCCGLVHTVTGSVLAHMQSYDCFSVFLLSPTLNYSFLGVCVCLLSLDFTVRLPFCHSSLLAVFLFLHFVCVCVCVERGGGRSPFFIFITLVFLF